MTDPDDIDEVFRNIRRFAENRREPVGIDEATFHRFPQIEDRGEGPEDELIIGDDYVTYLVYSEQETVEDFSVSTDDGFIEVETDDFIVKRPIGMTVDPGEYVLSYSNGVLSVRLKRLDESEAVG